MKNGVFRVKIDFEDTPIVNSKVKGVEGLYDLVKQVKKKMN